MDGYRYLYKSIISIRCQLPDACWGAAPSFRASSAATVTPLSHTASRTIGVFETPPPTRSRTGVTAAGFTRSTSGYGATVGTAPGWPGFPSPRRRGSGASVSGRAG
jgi:hypothetical protein